MPKFMDYHAKLPDLPPEAMQMMKQRIDSGEVDEFGSKAINVFLGAGGQAYCLSEAPDAEAVRQSHVTKGVPLSQDDIVEVSSVA